MPYDPSMPTSRPGEGTPIQVIIEGLEDLELNDESLAQNSNNEEPTAPKKPLGRPKIELKGLHFERFYTRENAHPFDMVDWELRDAIITNEKGEKVFEQTGVEVPKFWSQQATNIVVSKYFRGQIGQPNRETSVRQVVSRVAKTISDWGRRDGYFATPQDADIYEAELTYLLLTQRAAFNSPVWFNVGIEAHPQCSACFINAIEDDMKAILQLAVTEGMLFKYGSGTGTNLSPLRSSYEHLHNSEGRSSGPVSFMKGYDAFAGVIKSGGKTRRAAKMVILNVDHPDILDFIRCKAREEQKAWALIDAGYDGSFGGEAYSSIFYQNANNSVRVTDDFMKAVEQNGSWTTKYVLTGQDAHTYQAQDLMKEISDSAWICGDPGLQFHTTINKWHTCSNTAPINASNPCSEYMFLDDSACNLASLNLMLFRKPDGEFDTEAFKHASAVIITAMEIIVGNSSYPTEKITYNSKMFRPLGMGYANLGALLMSLGLPYNSDAGRAYAAAITALMSGHAYRQSALIAKEISPFEGYSVNREPMLKVIGMHRDASRQLAKLDVVPDDLRQAAQQAWDEALSLGQDYGFRNAQISVLAPTGTIAFMMDCDTTGVEPDIALIKYKWLVGGGLMKMVNRTVPQALDRLGYGQTEKEAILKYLDEHDTLEGAPGLKEEHLPVFDCAFKPANGTRSIHYSGHLKMMAAVQPFLSGAISKTVNMPNSTTVEEIQKTYIEAWQLGLKSIAIYRDGCKRAQPLTTKKEMPKQEVTKQGSGDIWVKPAASSSEEIKQHDQVDTSPTVMPPVSPIVSVGQNALPLPRADKPYRRKLPDERKALTHKFSIGGHEGYITVGLYEDGQPGEIFLVMNKEGSVISGLMDAFATALSLALQYGVPVKSLVNKFAHVRFEPSGYTNNPHIRIAKSIIDYVARWLGYKFLPHSEHLALGINGIEHNPFTEGSMEVVAEAELEINKKLANNELKTETASVADPITDAATANDLSGTFQRQTDAPPCDMCGALMVRNGSCYKCLNCGSVSGCS